MAFGYGNTGTEKAPTYAVRSLSDEELEDEILRGKGDPGWKAALVAEHERRSRSGAPPEPARRSPSYDADEWGADL